MAQVPQRIPTSNLIGFWTLYAREVRRFMKVHTQTVAAPVVTTLLFLAVFTLALGRDRAAVAGVVYSDFLAPGLIMMAIAQNAFANTSSSLMTAKVQGNIVDTLMSPLTAQELTAGMALGGVTRGLVVGLSVTIAMLIVVGLQVHSIAFILYHAVMASLMLSLLGLMGAIWAPKYDHISAINSFAITPLAFLSGSFYSIERLPETANLAAQFNPFFYMIDGFRYGFIGHADGSLTIGVVLLAVANLALWWITVWMFKSGYKLKA